MNQYTKTNLRLGKLRPGARPPERVQPTTAAEEAVLFGITDESSASKVQTCLPLPQRESDPKAGSA